jgi:hypothetical protein
VEAAMMDLHKENDKLRAKLKKDAGDLANVNA